MSMEIVIAENRNAFTHGENIGGLLRWNLDQAPRWLELRLFWYTEGKGTQNVGVEAQQRFTDLSISGERPFQFIAPAHPPSCSGKLVSIRWALELVSNDAHEIARVEVVIAPDAREIMLGSAT